MFTQSKITSIQFGTNATFIVKIHDIKCQVTNVITFIKLHLSCNAGSNPHPAADMLSSSVGICVHCHSQKSIFDNRLIIFIPVDNRHSTLKISIGDGRCSTFKKWAHHANCCLADYNAFTFFEKTENRGINAIFEIKAMKIACSFLDGS